MFKIKVKLLCYMVGLFVFCACQQESQTTVNSDSKNVEKNHTLEVDSIASFAAYKYRQAIQSLTDSTMIPRNANSDGTWHVVEVEDWTSGFFSGTLWNIYELTGDTYWIEEARKWSAGLNMETLKRFDHDLGFQFYCSHGNDIRLTDGRDSLTKKWVLSASDALMARFNPKTGVIKSWDWKHENWDNPTIIDNMMNLEMLLWAFQETGDSSYYHVAVSHADVTLEHHFREDYSTYHVLDYDSLSGEVVGKFTFQGFADSTMWARGQAWAIYGFSFMYRETKLERYLTQARKAADIFIERLPDDNVPYWDFDDPKIPNVPKDASAAAVAASAMLEMATFEQEAKKSKYYEAATKMLKALSTDEYLSKNTKHQGVLLHSTGHLPADSEIDAHINYADYYYLEALNRFKKLKNQ